MASKLIQDSSVMDILNMKAGVFVNRSLTFSRQSEYEVTGDDAMDNVQMEKDTSTIKSAIIVGVPKFIIHVTCLNCSGKLCYR